MLYAYKYAAWMARSGAFYSTLGLLFLPIVYLMLMDSAPGLLLIIALFVPLAAVTARHNAYHVYSIIKKHQGFYAEYNRFLIEKRWDFLMPGVIRRRMAYSLTAFFSYSGWTKALYNIFYNVAYVLIIMLPYAMDIVRVKKGYAGLSIILLWYCCFTFHWLFYFLFWKYRIARQIKEEHGYDYNVLIAVD